MIDTQTQQFANELRRRLRVRLNELADDLAGGVCRNIEDYRKICGQIEGLAEAERALLDLVDRLRKDPDDADADDAS